MNRNTWGGSRKLLLTDLQTLVIVLIILGFLVYLLFPGFYQTILAGINGNNAVEDVVQPTNLTTIPQMELPLVFQQVYPTDQPADFSKGYWVVFIRDGQFEQMALTQAGYLFVAGLIDKDRSNRTRRVFLSTEGQFKQVLVSDEVNAILSQLAAISLRSLSP